MVSLLSDAVVASPVNDEQTDELQGEDSPTGPRRQSRVNMKIMQSLFRLFEHRLAVQQPSFEFVPRALSQSVVQKLLASVEMGLDPSCGEGRYFVPRRKAIRFVLVFQGKLFPLSQDFFVQPAEYNDFSGGYQRRYQLLPHELFANPAGSHSVLGGTGKQVGACLDGRGLLFDAVTRFVRAYKLPDKCIILLQIQTSEVPLLEVEEKGDSDQHSLTGQGIHTDGTERAFLVCLHRGAGIRGADNVFHARLDGSRPLCELVTLEAGSGVLFKDNRVFHQVTRGHGTAGEDNCRCMLLMHATAEFLLCGDPNPNNRLGRNEASVQLRRGGEEKIRSSHGERT